MATMFSFQFRSQKVMMKKMDLADLRRVATEVMTGRIGCRCNLNAWNIPFAGMGTDATRNVATVRYNFADDTCAGSSLLATSQNIPTNNLIDRIQIENVTPSAIPDTFNYELAFYPRIDPGETSLAPVRITNLAAQVSGGDVTACGSAGGFVGASGININAIEFEIVHTTLCQWNNDVHTMQAICPDGYRMIGCTGGPGDLHEAGEGSFIRPRPDLNGCEQIVRGHRCTPSADWTHAHLYTTCIR